MSFDNMDCEGYDQNVNIDTIDQKWLLNLRRDIFPPKKVILYVSWKEIKTNEEQLIMINFSLCFKKMSAEDALTRVWKCERVKIVLPFLKKYCSCGYIAVQW